MLRQILPVIRRSIINRNTASRQISTTSKKCGIYEPDYLEALKPKYPQYSCLNFHIKGYDYPVLESYQKWLHGVAEYLSFEVSDCYALPPKHLQVQRFKPNSAVVDGEYKLTIYQRNILVSNLDAPMYPFFLRIAQAALPEGVTLEIVDHTDEHEELRYVPDKNLIELKAQLDGLQSPQKNK